MRKFSALILVIALLSGSQTYAAKARTFEYLSRPGDSLQSIARRFLVNPDDWQSLRKLNRLPDGGPVKPGSSIRIPIAAMRVEPAMAQVIDITGPATSDAGSLGSGQSLAEGARISTGNGGIAAIRLANGSLLRVQPNTRLVFSKLRQLSGTDGIPDYLIELKSGRIDVTATNSAVATVRFQIRTPVAHVNVDRGSFRVSYDPVSKRAFAEVTEGVENLQRNNKYKAEVLPAGFAAFADAVTPPNRFEMLAAPDLAGVQNTGAGTEARFQFPDLPAVVAYRADVAFDEAFTKVIASQTVQKSELEFKGLPDGRLFLRVRGITADGMEGKNALLAFQSGAPGPVAPLATVSIAPTATVAAIALEPATSSVAAGAAPVAAAAQVATPPATATPPKAAPETAPAPAPAPAPVTVPAPDLSGTKNTGVGSISRFQFPPASAATAYRADVALDADFKSVIASATSSKPEIEFNGLPAGRLFLRVRGVSAGGIEGKNSSLAFESGVPASALPSAKANTAIQMPNGQMAFSWGSIPEAAAYRIQVSRSASFSDVLVDQIFSSNANVLLAQRLEAGDYFWRVAAVNRLGASGAFGETNSFSVGRGVATSLAAQIRGAEARFSWVGEAGQRFHFQLSQNERFTKIIADSVLDVPEIVIKNLGKNVYFARIRYLEKGANVGDPGAGPWSEILQLEVYGSLW